MKMKKADVAVAIYIMAAIIMFIVPIPSWLLDILLAINISVRKYWICPSSLRCCCLPQSSVLR